MSKVLKRLFRYILTLIVVLIVIVLMFVLSYTIYLNSSLTKKLDNIPGFEDLSISFDKIDFELLDSYPHCIVELDNLTITQQSEDIPYRLFEAYKIKLYLTNHRWEDRQLRIDSIMLDSSSIFIDENLIELFRSFKQGDQQIESDNEWKFDFDDALILINRSLFSYSNNTTDKHVETFINSAIVKSDLTNSTYRTMHSDLDFITNDFTLNSDNGSFLKDAHVRGEFTINHSDQSIEIEKTQVQINNEEFVFSAQFNNDGDEQSRLYFQNDNTSLSESIELLSENLKTTLFPYKIAGEFWSETHLTMTPNSPIRVDIDYRMSDNDITINNVEYKDARVRGHFVNDNVYDPKFTKQISERRFIRFDIMEATSISRGINIELDNAVILAGPEHPVDLTSAVRLSGETQLMSYFLKNEKFIYKGGYFMIDSKVNGRLSSLQDMIHRSDIDLTILDSDVTYIPSNVMLPLKSVILSKKSNNADFDIKGLTIEEDYDLLLNGNITNLTGLLFDLKNSKAESNAVLKAKRLTWQDLIFILGQGSKQNIEKSEIEQRKSMKQTLRGIQYHFDPNLKVIIDSSGYYEFTSIENIKGRIHFPQHQVLKISDTEFALNGGNVEFDCRIDLNSDAFTPFNVSMNAKNINVQELLPPLDYFGVAELKRLKFLPEDFDVQLQLKGIIDDENGIIRESLSGNVRFNTTNDRIALANIDFRYEEVRDSITGVVYYPIDTQIEFKGNPYVFNDYLENDKFFFNDGEFQLELDYFGDELSLDNIIEDSQLSLRIDSSQVLYKPLSVTFPLTNIDLNVNRDTASYSILMNSNILNQEVALSGHVINISEILLSETGKRVQTTSHIRSPRITWDNFIDIFDIDTSSTNIMGEDQSGFRNNIVSLLHSFRPELQLDIDTIEYSENLAIYNFEGDVFMQDSTLRIHNNRFDYRDGHISLSLNANLSADDIEKFNANIKTESIDIQEFMFDIGQVSDLRFPHLSGVYGTVDTDIDFDYDSNGMDFNLKQYASATIDFKLRNLKLENVPWAQSIGRKIRQEQRFDNVRFADIENKMHYSNNTLHIPLMEIQSNAFDIFIEGYYHAEHPNIWMSIPIFNLKERNLSVVPEKEGYAKRKLKFHLQYALDKKKRKKLKLRLSKKKFYKNAR